MTLSPSLSNYSTILVVDINSAAANQLAAQLRHSGFLVDVAVSAQAAHLEVRAKHYDTLVTVVDLNQSGDVYLLKDLRKSSQRSWIIVISSAPCTHALQIVFRCGADSLLSAPFSIEELTFRLSALSIRSRPP